jgi:hypothetical protein
MLHTQTRWTFGAVLLTAVAAFAIPILSVQHTSIVQIGGQAPADGAALRFLQVMEGYGVLYTIVAGIAGLMLATLSWSADHRGRHVYALILPLERWRFVLYRYGAGIVLLLVPVFALWIGGILAVAATAIPAGLTPYPTALAIRFALAAMVAYSLFFAISSGTTRTAAVVLAPIAILILADVLTTAAGMRLRLMETVLAGFFEWPGVLEIFTGRWLLVDV